MPENVASREPRVVSVRANNEVVASEAFRDALHGRPIRDLAKVEEISGFTSPQNWVTLARAALVHGGHIQPRDFDDLLTTASTEFGSGLYDFSWSLCTYATIPTPRAVEVYTAMLAATALCLCPANQIELQFAQDRHGRRDRNFGMADYRGPISMLPGNRMIWRTGEAALYAERCIAAPLAAWALGQEWGWKDEAFDHATLGWAMEVAYPRQTPGGHQHGHVVELPNETAELIARVDKLKMRSNQRLDLLLLPNGGKFALLTPSTIHTRGPVLVTEYLPEQQLLRQISPSESTGHGQWSACSAELKPDFTWAVWQSGNVSKRIEGRVAEPETHIVWDQEGCRIAGSVQLPDPIPEIQQAGGLFHSALLKLGRQGLPDSEDREARGRTAFEIMRLIAQDKRSKARLGTEHLLADMHEWDAGPDALPPPIPEIRQAGGSYDLGLRKLGQQGHADSRDREERGRTAFEVMRLITEGERSSARQGARDLYRDMRARGW